MKKEYLEQAMMELDDRLIARAARPAAKRPRRWSRVALAAACMAALLAVTAGAGVVHWQYIFRQEDKVTIMANHSDPAEQPAAPVPTGIYLPTVRPADEHLKAVSRIGESVQWDWHIDGRIPVSLSQHPVDHPVEIVYLTPTGDWSEEIGQLEWDGITVGYRTQYFRGNLNETTLRWEDGTYQYILECCFAQPEDLKDMVTSMESISNEEYMAMKALAQKTAADLTRCALKQVLVPSARLESLDFQYTRTFDSLKWSFASKDNYGMFTVSFYQEDLDCAVSEESQGEAWRRWEMQDNSYARQTELAGMPAQLLDSDELWEYFWEQDGNWCVLSVSKEIADRMDLTMEELAQQIVGGLVLVPAADVQAAMDAMK